MYTEAYKYALLNAAKIRPHLKAYEETQSTEQLADLAHNFHLMEDPRGDVLDRHLQRGRNPEGSYMGHRILLPGQDVHNTYYVKTPITRAESKDAAYNFMAISPVAKTPEGTKADAVHIMFNHKSDGKHMVFQGLFAPHEARNIANKLSPGDRQEVHRMLDRHFGK
jgi:hypothetical protein